MRPLDFKGARPFEKPADWDGQRDGECVTLPVLVDGPYRISLWTFNDRERAEIAKGAQLHLCVYGSQPPVSLWLIDKNSSEAIDDTMSGWDHLAAAWAIFRKWWAQ